MLVGQGNGQVTEQVDELERSDQGVVFQSASEDAELDRGSVLQVDGRVSTTAVCFLGVIQDLFGPFLITVPSGPAIHLTGRPTAELQQLLPVFLEEVEQAGDRCVLFFLSFSKGISADVDVQTAGIRLVRFESFRKVIGLT